MNLISWNDVTSVIVPIASVVLGIVFWVQKQVGTESTKRTILEKEFNEFREKVARDNVTHEYLTRFEDRILEAIGKLGERFDRLLEGRKEPE